jgi:hypothetical protein
MANMNYLGLNAQNETISCCVKAKCLWLFCPSRTLDGVSTARSGEAERHLAATAHEGWAMQK